jgi:multiple sugar transport system substrate-binding protein
MSDDQLTLFGRPVDRRTLLSLTGKVLAGGTVVGMWLSPELAQFVDAAARGRKMGGSITVMSQYSPNVAKWKSYINMFTKETGIKVNFDDQNYNNQYQKITTQGQAGTHGDDVVAIDTIWTGSFGAAGFTLDLTDFLPASLKQQIAEAALASVSYKGKMYGVPAYNSAKHFYYNKKMLDMVGLHRPPATLDELLKYCDVLKRNKKKLGIEYPMSWSWAQKEALTCDFVQMIDSLGGQFFAKDSVTPVFNKDAGVQALTMMKLMLDKGYAAPASLTHIEVNVEDDLLAGKTAMCTTWEGLMSRSVDPTQASKSVLGQIRIALIPGSARRKSGSCLGPEGWALMKTSQHQREAKAFLNWYVTKSAQKQGMLLFDQPPIYSSMYNDPTLRKLVAKSDGQDDFPVYGHQYDYAQARPNFPGYLDASLRLQVQLHKAFLGQESPKKALDTAAAQMRAASGGGNNP